MDKVIGAEIYLKTKNLIQFDDLPESFINNFYWNEKEKNYSYFLVINPSSFPTKTKLFESINKNNKEIIDTVYNFLFSRYTKQDNKTYASMLKGMMREINISEEDDCDTCVEVVLYYD